MGLALGFLGACGSRGHTPPGRYAGFGRLGSSAEQHVYAAETILVQAEGRLAEMERELAKARPHITMVELHGAINDVGVATAQVQDAAGGAALSPLRTRVYAAQSRLQMIERQLRLTVG